MKPNSLADVIAAKKSSNRLGFDFSDALFIEWSRELIVKGNASPNEIEAVVELGLLTSEEAVDLQHRATQQIADRVRECSVSSPESRDFVPTRTIDALAERTGLLQRDVRNAILAMREVAQQHPHGGMSIDSLNEFAEASGLQKKEAAAVVDSLAEVLDPSTLEYAGLKRLYPPEALKRPEKIQEASSDKVEGLGDDVALSRCVHRSPSRCSTGPDSQQIFLWGVVALLAIIAMSGLVNKVRESERKRMAEDLAPLIDEWASEAR